MSNDLRGTRAELPVLDDACNGEVIMGYDLAPGKDVTIFVNLPGVSGQDDENKYVNHFHFNMGDD